ncbi:AAA family ATPase [Streptacidiphilus sp. P02-A3a]|uniref:AAA family ATPase n=1 Tax=Streptacidiphilus sp. P02-A3a TaxID=2704468 RepID=UPI0015FA222E|nr:ATP-binding protein [Streptacidiphilus sp. P02-A3a]QMU72406.1 ATP-binding protein [Streptacidiphilus sp. P02-A3a]
MIERIEIDGFKSFKDFTLDVPPLLVVAGANASGKSNALDALRLLAETVRDPVAFHRFNRGTGMQLLRQSGDGSRCRELRINVSISLPGTSGTVRTFEPSLYCEVLHPHPRDATLRVTFGPRTGESGADYDLVDQELGSWLFLDPVCGLARMRADGTDRGRLAPDASNLAAVLGRFSESDTLAELMLDACAVIPALDDVVPVRDHRGDWDYDLRYREQGAMSPSVASDGTLRVLALLAAVHDPENPGTVIVDEIESGLHPSRLATLLSRIADRTRPDQGRPGRQVIVTTHSPVVVSHMLAEGRDAVVFFDSVFHPEEVDGVRVGSMITRARGVGETGVRGTYVTPIEVRNYLETVRRDTW